jgi:hypothetical protein
MVSPERAIPLETHGGFTPYFGEPETQNNPLAVVV